MRATFALVLLSVLAACKQDPYERPQTWHLPPTGFGANDSNLRAMLVNPNDLAAGASDDTSTGPLSVRPIDALVTGRRKPLPSVNASTIGAGSTQQSGQAAGGQGGSNGGGAQ
ncbi:MAG TPA: hypothetical protein VGM42_10225 [Rhodopila sp.]